MLELIAFYMKRFNPGKVGSVRCFSWQKLRRTLQNLRMYTRARWVVNFLSSDSSGGGRAFGKFQAVTSAILYPLSGTIGGKIWTAWWFV